VNPGVTYDEHPKITNMPKFEDFTKCGDADRWDDPWTSSGMCSSCVEDEGYASCLVIDWAAFHACKKKIIAERKKEIEDAGWVAGGHCCNCEQKLSVKVRGTGHKWCAECQNDPVIGPRIQAWKDAYKLQ